MGSKNEKEKKNFVQFIKDASDAEDTDKKKLIGGFYKILSKADVGTFNPYSDEDPTVEKLRKYLGQDDYVIEDKEMKQVHSLFMVTDGFFDCGSQKY
ncbi:MAG: hypothetical protein HN888_12110 [Desulfobacula sp.]|jgi:hypothetical protein|nr:hypothetical protein [Desulfobacula sp.]